LNKQWRKADKGMAL